MQLPCGQMDREMKGHLRGERGYGMVALGPCLPVDFGLSEVPGARVEGHQSLYHLVPCTDVSSFLLPFFFYVGIL